MYMIVGLAAFSSLVVVITTTCGAIGGGGVVGLIVIAIGDYYRFAFFGLVTKLWLKFQGLFY